ncbi:epoxide hydrolase family protein [Pseudomonas sp.]|uniref:epoxide hydrolase family protein n=1 Tax=Pseudomonas sp. TaxID=306 RepID=UPI003F3827A4
MTINPSDTKSVSAEIRPFHFRAQDSELTELRRRIEATRWPDKETVTDSSQGVQLATIQKLARHWATQYDWRVIESKINAVPNFITNIDSLDIHFLHIRSKHENALPLLMAHGWPGSIIELMKVIGPLTDPVAHGGSASDAFSLVIPSMPGYGFSEKPTVAGWNPERIADAYIELMKRLGYTRYGAQGGDWGSIVVDLMAVKAPPGLIGIHSNMPGVIPPGLDAALFRGDPVPSGLSAEEKQAADQLANTYKHIGYAIMMGDRPQSLTGLNDSPVGLAAFMLDHDPKSYEMIARSIDGQPEGLTPDDVLDNITLFWLTKTAVSSGRLYWENKSTFFAVKGVNIPVAVSVFPDELYAAPKSWSEQAYPKLVHYNKLPKGGHFAAWEQPALFSQEVRAGFKSLR